MDEYEKYVVLLLNQNQFRSIHSTDSALPHMTDIWLQAIKVVILLVVFSRLSQGFQSDRQQITSSNVSRLSQGFQSDRQQITSSNVKT